MSDAKPDSTDEKLAAAFDQLEQQPNASPKGGGSGFGILAIFLSLIAVGIATYPAYELYRQANQPDDTNAYVDSSLDQLRQEIGGRDNKISRLEAQIQEMSTRVNQEDKGPDLLAERLDTELASIRNAMTTSSDDWLFAEIEYLVRMANQRALMENDATAALQLLQAADEIVRDAEGLAAHGLRQALIEDIAALKAVNAPDIQGTYLELSALIKQVAGLKRVMPTYNPVIPESTTLADNATFTDRLLAAFSGAFTRLSHLVDFRRRDEAVKPLLPPDQEYYLRQNLILKLQIAQMALLEGEAAVYQASTEDASAWVARSFDDDAAAAAMRAALDGLASVPVSIEMPDISGSLNAVRSRLEGFSAPALLQHDVVSEPADGSGSE